MLGLDAPRKIDIRFLIDEWAQRNGLDTADVLEAAEDLFRGLTG